MKTLVGEVLQRTAQNAFLCYQCVKCSAGCPLSEHFDLAPNQVMRAVQLGRDEQALNSTTIWLCASCQTCSTRCPQGLDVARIMDALRMIAHERGVKPRVPAVAAFQSVFLRDVALLGRSYKPALIAEMNLRTLSPLKDMAMGMRMVTKGKVKLLPSIARLPTRPKRMAQPGEIAYYPGCSLHSLSSELDASLRAVAGELGLKLVEPAGWTCCGSSAAHGSDHTLATTLPMQNLAFIEKSGFTEATAPCSACYLRFKTALHDVGYAPPKAEVHPHPTPLPARESELAAPSPSQGDLKGESAAGVEGRGEGGIASLRNAVEQRTGYQYQNRLRILSLLDLLTEKVGLDTVAAHVSKPLHGLRVVSYYGCLLTRPPEITGAEHAENPRQMDAIVAALGADAVDWSYKTDCCGGSLSLTKTDLALALTRKLLLAARSLHADVITTSCPMCHVNLDARQAQLGLDFEIPVLYITQLMGLAYGLPAKRLALEKNMVSTAAVAARVM